MPAGSFQLLTIGAFPLCWFEDTVLRLQRSAKVQDSSDSVVAAGGGWCIANLLSFAVARPGWRSDVHCPIVRTSFIEPTSARLRMQWCNGRIDPNARSITNHLPPKQFCLTLVPTGTWFILVWQVSLLILQHSQVSTWCSPWDLGEYVSLIWDSPVVLTLTRIWLVCALTSPFVLAL